MLNLLIFKFSPFTVNNPSSVSNITIWSSKLKTSNTPDIDNLFLFSKLTFCTTLVVNFLSSNAIKSILSLFIHYITNIFSTCLF